MRMATVADLEPIIGRFRYRLARRIGGRHFANHPAGINGTVASTAPATKIDSPARPAATTPYVRLTPREILAALGFDVPAEGVAIATLERLGARLAPISCLPDDLVVLDREMRALHQRASVQACTPDEAGPISWADRRRLASRPVAPDDRERMSALYAAGVLRRMARKGTHDAAPVSDAEAKVA